MKPPKIFRDPLYNYISIDRENDQWLLDLLDTPEVQRLRRIHQLGVSFFTYTGADHSRLSHSLGVLHLMQQAVEHLKGDSKAHIGAARHALLASALLHDVGHAPFSHLFEGPLGLKHEQWSCQAVLSPDTEVNAILKGIDADLPKQVAELIKKDNFNRPLWQKNLLSSQLDVDRLDYLRRDSLFTGSGYGHFDWYRIVHTFELYGNPNLNSITVWPDKTKYSIEEYIFARFYMYENVYMHKTTRGYEKLLHAMWKIARQMFDNGDSKSIVKPIKEFWKAKDPSFRQFEVLEESVVLYQIQEWQSHKNKALADLAHRFLNRKGFGSVPAPLGTNPLDDLSEWKVALHKLVKKYGYSPPESYVLTDEYEIEIYAPYRPEKSDEQTPSNAIRIVNEKDGPQEITMLLPRLKAVIDKPKRTVLYYLPKEPKELIEEAKKLKADFDKPAVKRPRRT